MFSVFSTSQYEPRIKTLPQLLKTIKVTVGDESHILLVLFHTKSIKKNILENFSKNNEKYLSMRKHY
tara:strand:- start:122 stop:322 length:201 start_codon:yes stop_codon:yes gene_type:complete